MGKLGLGRREIYQRIVKMEQNIESAAMKTNRVEALSDGVFAIAMTVLIISFETLFERPKALSNFELYNILIQLWPDFLHYVLSFMILGVFWILHHTQFQFIKRTDIKLLFINIIGLMFVSLLPFTTAIAGDYGHILLGSLAFEFNLLIAGLVFYLHWAYAVKHKLVEPQLDSYIIKSRRVENLIIPSVSLAAIFITLFAPRAGTLSYFIVPLILILFNKTIKPFLLKHIRWRK
jgi:uncharacterized membrane protein